MPVSSSPPRSLRPFSPLLFTPLLALALASGQCDVMLIAYGSNQKTSSGKLQRRACRARYLDGAW